MRPEPDDERDAAELTVRPTNPLHTTTRLYTLPAGERISIDGGVSVNRYFCQFLANALQREVAVKPMTELTALGTAQLAGARAIIQPTAAGAIKTYQPEISERDYLTHLGRAVQRARDWRQ